MKHLFTKIVVVLAALYIAIKLIPVLSKENTMKEGADFTNNTGGADNAFYYPFSLAGKGGDIPSFPSFRNIPATFNHQFFSLADDPYRAVFKPNQEFDQQFLQSNQVSKAAFQTTCSGDVSPHYY